MQDCPTNKTGYELYSDLIHRVYPTYKLDDRLRLVPGPDTPTVNFSVLKELLLSKDLSRNDELEWVDSGLRFLDGTVDLAGNRVCFPSFPRTGNTMTRATIEAVTGVATGSCMNLRLTCHIQAQLMGEEHTCDDNSVWVTKSHWPVPEIPLCPEKPVTFDKSIVIVRNFLDVLPSLFLLMNTGSHSMKTAQPIN
jgi:hypothetical protein